MGSKSPKPVSSQTVTNEPPAYIREAQTKVLNRGEELSNRPYQKYTDPLVAGFTGDQYGAFNQVRNAQGMAQPYINAGAGLSFQSAQGVNPMEFNEGAVQRYMNPYLNSAVNAAMGNINQTNQIQQNQMRGNAIAKGAFGGDRAGIAQAELARNQNLASQQTISDMYSKGYAQAQDMFNKQQEADMKAQQQTGALQQGAAGQIAQFGTDAQKNALQAAQALSGIGAQQQELAQSQLGTDYQQFMNEQQYPFQNLNWLTGLISGNTSGGTSTSTNSQAGPSGLSQAIGGATALSGLLGMKFADGGVVGYAGGGVPYGGGAGTPYSNSKIMADKGFGNIFSDGSVSISAPGGNKGVGIPSAQAPQVQQDDNSKAGMGMMKNAQTANGKGGESLFDRGKSLVGDFMNPEMAADKAAFFANEPGTVGAEFYMNSPALNGSSVIAPTESVTGAAPMADMFSGVGNAMNGIGTGVGEAAGGLANTIGGIGTGIGEAATGLAGGIGEGLGALGAGIGEAAGGLGGALAGAGTAALEGLGGLAAGAGGALAGAGAAAAEGLAAFLPLLLLSDERTKENKEVVGKMFDGTDIYKYNYKGDPAQRTQMGIMAQDIEGKYPDAVHKTVDGIRMVDYDAATAKSAEKGGFADGGVAFGDYGFDTTSPEALMTPEERARELELQDFYNNEPVDNGIAPIVPEDKELQDFYNNEPEEIIQLEAKRDIPVNAGIAPKNDPFLGVPRNKSIADVDLKNIDPRMIDHMMTMWDKYPNLGVSSGYRSPERNSQVGGARGSQHIQGKAVDFDLKSLTPEERQAFAVDTANNPDIRGVGMYNKQGTSLHADVRDGARAAWGPDYTGESIAATPDFFQKLVADFKGMGDSVGSEIGKFASQFIPSDNPTSEGMRNALHRGADRSSGAGVQIAGGGAGDMNVSDVALRNAAMNEARRGNSLPSPQESKSILGQIGINMSPEAAQGLLAAGLGMMAGTSPFAGVNIGQGGLKGVEAYGTALANNRNNANIQSEIRSRDTKTNMEVEGLYRQAVDNATIRGINPPSRAEFFSQMSGASSPNLGVNSAPSSVINNVPVNSPIGSQLVSNDVVGRAISAARPDTVNSAVVNGKDVDGVVMSPEAQNLFKLAQEQRKLAAGMYDPARQKQFLDQAATYEKEANSIQSKIREKQKDKDFTTSNQEEAIAGVKGIPQEGYDKEVNRQNNIKRQKENVGTAILAPKTSEVQTVFRRPPHDYDNVKVTDDKDINKNFNETYSPEVMGGYNRVGQSLKVASDALKLVKSGATQPMLASYAAVAKDLGFDKLSEAMVGGNVSEIQKIAKESFRSSVASMGAASSRFTQLELLKDIENNFNTGQDPATNKSIISQELGKVRMYDSMVRDWEKAKELGWKNAGKFQSEWMALNPLDSFVKAANRELGNFKGQDLPALSEFVPNATYVMPDAGMLSKNRTQMHDQILASGVKPGAIFKYDYRDGKNYFTPLGGK